VAEEDANFFIIVNDKEIKEKINYFIFHLGADDSEGAKIPYNGENYVKFSDKVPTYSYDNDLQIKIEAYSNDDEKYLFRVFKNTDYVLKYPMGPLPGRFEPSFQESLKKENLSFVDIGAGYEEGKNKGIGYSDMYMSEYFDADFAKNVSKEDLVKIIEDNKDSAKVTGAPYQGDPTVNFEEIKPIDDTIEKIYLATGYNSMISVDAFYDCEAYILVVQNIKGSENQKIYSFKFRKKGKNIDTGAYQGQIEEFNKMVRTFAKNITMQKYPEKDVEDLKQTISVSTNMNPHPVFKEYNLDGEFQSSGVYNEIMAGGEPGVEKLAKEKKKMDNRKFEISFRYNNEVTIWNSGVVNTGTDKDTNFPISVNIDGKAYDKNGKIIKDISDEELYKDVYLLYEIINPKSQIHFQEADVGDNKLKVKVDNAIESQYLQSTGPILYTGAFLPTEYVAVYLVDKDENLISGRYLYKVHMKDASPQIETEKNVMEIDDVADGFFKFKVNDEYHDKVMCTVKVPYEKYLANKIPIVKISEYGQGEVGTQIQEFECETNKWITIRVKPPKLSNFDMLSELNGLNMWDLQRGTMESFATDLVGFGVDVRLDKLGDKKKLLEGLYTKGYTGAKGVFNKVDKIEKTMRYVGRANDLAGDAQNAIKITQLKSNIEGHVKDYNKATEVKGTKTLLESTYDWGIGGINILQSTVGAIAMAPKHIPFVGKYAQKVTGTFSLVFNLMTNVWKGNLEYLSKEKKIDRAQEKNIPYPVMIGVTSKEGFRDVEAQVVSVLYNYLEN